MSVMPDSAFKKSVVEIEQSRKDIANLQERVLNFVAKRRKREAMAQRVADSIATRNAHSEIT
jgi:hypothetical protein